MTARWVIGVLRRVPGTEGSVACSQGTGGDGRRRMHGGYEHMADGDLDPGTPWRRDLDSVGPALERWAKHAIGDAVTVSDVSAPANGMSSETVLFQLVRGDGEP